MVKRFHITAYLVNPNEDYTLEEREILIGVFGATYRYNLPIDEDPTGIELLIDALIKREWTENKGYFFNEKEFPRQINLYI